MKWGKERGRWGRRGGGGGACWAVEGSTLPLPLLSQPSPCLRHVPSPLPPTHSRRHRRIPSLPHSPPPHRNAPPPLAQRLPLSHSPSPQPSIPQLSLNDSIFNTRSYSSKHLLSLTIPPLPHLPSPSIILSPLSSHPLLASPLSYPTCPTIFPHHRGTTRAFLPPPRVQ